MLTQFFKKSVLFTVIGIFISATFIITGVPVGLHPASVLAADHLRTSPERKDVFTDGGVARELLDQKSDNLRVNHVIPKGAKVEKDFTLRVSTHTAAVLTEQKFRGEALRAGLDPDRDKKEKKAITTKADGSAKGTYQQDANRYGVILVVRSSEGVGRDGVIESFRAAEIVIPDVLKVEQAEVIKAINEGKKVYISKNKKEYPIHDAIMDVIEGTNALVFDVGGKELADLKKNESGATSIIVTGSGVGKAGNVPDVYADVIATYVPPDKRQEFLDNPLDPELLAADPAKIEDVLARIAAANGISINKLNVVVMERNRETTRLAVLEGLQKKYRGLEVTTVKDGTVAPTLLATLGDKEGNHKVIMTVGGTPEAFFNLSVAGLFKEQGALLSLRIYSKRVNDTIDEKKEQAVDLQTRYNFDDKEKAEIRSVRKDDAEAILKGQRLFTQEMIVGDVNAAVSLITHNGVFGLPGAQKLDNGLYSVAVLRVGKVTDPVSGQSVPTAWFEPALVPSVLGVAEKGAHEYTARFADVQALHKALQGIIEVTPVGVRVLDREAFRNKLVDDLVYDSQFNSDKKVIAEIQRLMIDIAYAEGAYLSSVYPLYKGKAKDVRHYSIPAINVRGMAYNTARAIFESAIKNNVGPFILEIAKSEIGYTGQRPVQYTTAILAAALKEGYKGPINLQGDHFQIALKDYVGDEKKGTKGNPDKARQVIKDLIREAIQAGFYQIDLDMSPLVNWKESTPDGQQRLNYTETAVLTAYVRQLEREFGLDKKGIVVNLGGEIGEIGMGMEKGQQKNSTIVDLVAFMEGYNRELARLSQEAGYTLIPITKIAIQTGTMHGGVRDSSGKVIRAKVSFNTIAEIGRVAREKYGLAGVVQHGASTLPAEYFTVFAGKDVPEGLQLPPELLDEAFREVLRMHPAAEVHLATQYQDVIIDDELFPQELRERMHAWTLDEFITEVEGGKAPGEVLSKQRKNTWGPFKYELWNLPEETQLALRQSLVKQFDTVFKNLGVNYTRKYINLASWGEHLAPFAEESLKDINQVLPDKVMEINTVEGGRQFAIVINAKDLFTDSPAGAMALQAILRQVGNKNNIKIFLDVDKDGLQPGDTDAIVKKMNEIYGGKVDMSVEKFVSVLTGTDPQRISAQVKEAVGTGKNREIIVVGSEEYTQKFKDKDIIRAILDQSRDATTSTALSMAKALKLVMVGLVLNEAEMKDMKNEELKKLDVLFSTDGKGNFHIAAGEKVTSVEREANLHKMQVVAEVKL